METDRSRSFDFSLEDAGFKKRLWKHLKEAASAHTANAALLSDEDLDMVSAAGETDMYARTERKKEDY